MDGAPIYRCRWMEPLFIGVDGWQNDQFALKGKKFSICPSSKNAYVQITLMPRLENQDVNEITYCHEIKNICFVVPLE